MLPAGVPVSDVGVALLVQAAMTMPFVVPRGPELEPATWTAYGVSSLSVLPLVWRRYAPFAVLIAVLAAGGVYGLAVEGPGQPLPYAGLLAVYTVAALSPPAKRVACGLVLLTAVPVGVWFNTRSARELGFTAIVFVAAHAFGRLTDARRRATRVEAERAAARERSRIAREMHDILSHAVSLMIVQAEAGPVAVRAAPERAEAAFEAISETGRDAMTQLRAMLGLLRDDDVPQEDDDPRTPQPGLADLPALLDRVRSGGPAVVYETAGDLRPVPAATGTTVFRIVQEALTNTVRHAAARTVTVRVARDRDGLHVRVTDDGRGPRPATGPTGSGGPTGPGGHGLTGIRERAAAHGGTAAAGPGPDGHGFEVSVRLPLPAPTPVEATR
ncbi:sensor histidine kinase [Streptomyces sp. NPDC090994]|uniref:sensor histidine kinase n=1 Tax=Streptomyces sp. NPDC090994 TaxID=3365969 RepID=UPI00382D3BF2